MGVLFNPHDKPGHEGRMAHGHSLKSSAGMARTGEWNRDSEESKSTVCFAVSIKGSEQESYDLTFSL